MFESYKKFLLDRDVFEWIEWANAVKNDDLQRFIDRFDPSDDQMLFDPIELAIAFDAPTIYNHLLETYDYSDFYNQVDFSLLVILLLFEREHFLLIALEAYEFTPDHLLGMYEYIIGYKDAEYFTQFYTHYPLHPSYHKDLLRLAMNHYEIFVHLANTENMAGLLKDDAMMYDIIAYYPQYLSYLHDVSNLDQFKDSDLFMHVAKLESFEEFKQALHFILERGFDVKSHNDYGLSLYHQALRHARDPDYIAHLIELGADKDQVTTMGYPPAHQLLFREVRFTLELNDFVDFSAKDAYGLSLQDYDHMLLQNDLNYFDILRVVRVVLNMDESHFYELSEEEFYHMTMMQGMELLMPYVTILMFENSHHKDRYMHELSHQDFNAYDIMALKDMFPGRFEHDVNKTLQLELEFLEFDENRIKHFQNFAKEHNTTLIIESEDESINHKGKVIYTFKPTGKLIKKALVHSHLLDVFYLHFYFDIPLANIDYRPDIKNPQRFLN